MFARDGLGTIAQSWAILVLLQLPVWFVPGMAVWLRGMLSALLLALGGLVLYFFRDPHRVPPADSDHLVLAPADGRVVGIESVDSSAYMHGSVQQISIFLSVFNVHVNRVPVTGIVEVSEYIPGRFLLAWNPRASLSNERTEVGIRHESGTRVVVKQIAGGLARRIICRLTVGASVQAGRRYGLIKFGSRMDVLLPAGVPLTAKVGDRVRAGESILAHLAN